MVQTSIAEQIILATTQDYGTETIPFEASLGRVLGEDIVADRNLPPYNRATMDGIAVTYSSFSQGTRTYRIIATLAAGDSPVDTQQPDECVEIMTGAAVPPTLDTVVRYEDLDIKDGWATITTAAIKKGQNIHPEGRDKKQGDIVVHAPCYVDATVISMAASVGQSSVLVKKLPHIAIVTTGDELVDVTQTPDPYQIRKSNNHTIQATLQRFGIVGDMLHIADDLAVTKEKISECLSQYDVLILSGGVSMGKYDYLPQALEQLHVEQLFHKVQQRPGKPFWFGRHAALGCVVFAFPGNPVSGFMCLHRYFIPWLEASVGLPSRPPMYAQLAANVTFAPNLQYYMQVQLYLSDKGQLMARPLEGNGSGDFANLLDANAFIELPAEQTNFAAGDLYRIWPFKPVI